MSKIKFPQTKNSGATSTKQPALIITYLIGTKGVRWGPLMSVNSTPILHNPIVLDWRRDGQAKSSLTRLDLTMMLS